MARDLFAAERRLRFALRLLRRERDAATGTALSGLEPYAVDTVCESVCVILLRGAEFVKKKLDSSAFGSIYVATAFGRAIASTSAMFPSIRFGYIKDYLEGRTMADEMDMWFIRKIASVGFRLQACAAMKARAASFRPTITDDLAIDLISRVQGNVTAGFTVFKTDVSSAVLVGVGAMYGSEVPVAPFERVSEHAVSDTQRTVEEFFSFVPEKIVLDGSECPSVRTIRTAQEGGNDAGVDSWLPRPPGSGAGAGCYPALGDDSFRLDFRGAETRQASQDERIKQAMKNKEVEQVLFAQGLSRPAMT
jgi:hypothetical protein